MTKLRLHNALGLCIVALLFVGMTGITVSRHSCRIMENCGDSDMCETMRQIKSPSCCEAEAIPPGPSLVNALDVIAADECCSDQIVSARISSVFLPAITAMPDWAQILLADLPDLTIADFDVFRRQQVPYLARSNAPPGGEERYILLSSLLI